MAKKTYTKRILILGGLLAVLALLWFLTPLRDLSLEDLFNNRDRLIGLIRDNYLPAVLIFIGLYIVVVAFSIPGATAMTLMGGFFFGPWLGTLYVNLGATSGAFLLFLASRYFLGSGLQDKYGDKLEKFNREVEENGTLYLLSLRLVPVFPFFLINLLSGLTTVRPWTFFWTTALGIIPGSFVYTWLGHAGATIDEAGLPVELFIALVLMGLLSLSMVVVRKIRARRQGAAATTAVTGAE